jgi:hypothetical protein
MAAPKDDLQTQIERNLLNDLRTRAGQLRDMLQGVQSTTELRIIKMAFKRTAQVANGAIREIDDWMG